MRRARTASLAVGLLLVACTSAPSEGSGRSATGAAIGSTAGPLTDTAAARAAHTATVLADDSVLLVGGCDVDGCSTATNSVVRVAVDGSTTDGPRLLQARDGHTAALLDDGSVLVIGGFPGEGAAPMVSADILPTGSAAWRPTGALGVGRGGHTTARLGAGLVLVAGGWTSARSYTATTEVYDPRDGAFRPGPDLSAPVDGLASARLADGSVLVAGGQVRPGVATGAAVMVRPTGAQPRRSGRCSSPASSTRW